MNEQVKKTAIDCVKQGGAILLDYHRNLQSLQVQSKGHSDYVTEADLTVQEALVRLIRQHHPEHDILAEEEKEAPRRNATRWIIDPLDGTTNFIHGFPVFAISIAVEHDGCMHLGAVYDPSRDELFLAEKGRGATLNGQPLRVSTRNEPSQALIATGFPWREKALLASYLKVFSRIFTQVSDLRRTGSAALDLAYVASSRCDGFWEVGLKPWDIAAGHLLVQEAGGRVTDFTGGEKHIWIGDVIAGNPAMHELLLGVIQDVFGGNISSSPQGNQQHQ